MGREDLGTGTIIVGEVDRSEAEAAGVFRIISRALPSEVAVTVIQILGVGGDRIVEALSE